VLLFVGLGLRRRARPRRGEPRAQCLKLSPVIGEWPA
jgi:hypothetical protein